MSKKVKILLVDDSAPMRGYLSDLLRGRGFEVSAAAGLVDGLEAVLRDRPDAVLMDFVLEAGHTGLEALTAIFSLPAGQSKPLRAAILTHGKLAAADERRAQALGAAVLAKPEAGHEAAFFSAVDAWLAG